MNKNFKHLLSLVIAVTFLLLGSSYLQAAITQQAYILYQEASFAVRNGNSAEAVKKLKEAVTISPDYEEAHVLLGVCYINLNNLPEAENSLRTAINLNPNNKTSRVVLGQIYFLQKKADESIQEFQHASTMDARDPIPYVYLGEAYLLKNQPDDAISRFEQAITLNNGLVQAHLGLAKAYNMKGKKEEALEKFKYVLSVDPNNKEAQMAIRDLSSARTTVASPTSPSPASSNPKTKPFLGKTEGEKGKSGGVFLVVLIIIVVIAIGIIIFYLTQGKKEAAKYQEVDFKEIEKDLELERQIKEEKLKDLKDVLPQAPLVGEAKETAARSEEEAAGTTVLRPDSLKVIDVWSRCWKIKKCPPDQRGFCIAAKEGKNCWDLETSPCCEKDRESACASCSTYLIYLERGQKK